MARNKSARGIFMNSIIYLIIGVALLVTAEAAPLLPGHGAAKTTLVVGGIFGWVFTVGSGLMAMLIIIGGLGTKLVKSVRRGRSSCVLISVTMLFLVACATTKSTETMAAEPCDGCQATCTACPYPHKSSDHLDHPGFVCDQPDCSPHYPKLDDNALASSVDADPDLSTAETREQILWRCFFLTQAFRMQGTAASYIAVRSCLRDLQDQAEEPERKLIDDMLQKYDARARNLGFTPTEHR